MVELLAAHESGADLGAVPGVVMPGARARRRGLAGDTPAPAPAPPRPFAPDLDRLPFPARDLLPNAAYIRHGRRRYGSSVTTVMSTRGCPFACEFCSNVVFGESYRARSPVSVVDEVEQALALGYDRISFADDVFTLERDRVRRDLRRDPPPRPALPLGVPGAGRFRRRGAGPRDEARRLHARLLRHRVGQRRRPAPDEQAASRRPQARDAVEAAHRAGLEVGAFFILFYPGETDDTVLETLRFAGSLPLDYLGLSMPYPLPGTALHERLRDRIRRDARPDGSFILNQELTYDADFSALKMRLGIVKGHAQFEMRRRLGRLAPAALRLFEGPTDRLLRRMK